MTITQHLARASELFASAVQNSSLADYEAAQRVLDMIPYYLDHSLWARADQYAYAVEDRLKKQGAQETALRAK